MAQSKLLRELREGTVINGKSDKQEKQLLEAITGVIEKLSKTFNVELVWQLRLKNKNVIDDLKRDFPNVIYGDLSSDKSFLKPDGGFLYVLGVDGRKYPILISEKKRQGTNNDRLLEGKGKQAQGNAIERLGKNVIAFRCLCKYLDIFPFVCFGDGCDFEVGSSILDRVLTIAEYGQLNIEHLHKEEGFARGSFYFRELEWTREEMFDLCYSIAEKAVYYYYSLLGRDNIQHVLGESSARDAGEEDTEENN